MIRYAVVLAVGYVLGTKAGRRRYEQIAGTYQAVTESPATKAVIDAGRRKIADRVSPDPTMVTLTPIDAETAVLQPEAVAEKDASRCPGQVWPGSSGPRRAAAVVCRVRRCWVRRCPHGVPMLTRCRSSRTGSCRRPCCRTRPGTAAGDGRDLRRCRSRRDGQRRRPRRRPPRRPRTALSGDSPSSALPDATAASRGWTAPSHHSAVRDAHAVRSSPLACSSRLRR